MCLRICAADTQYDCAIAHRPPLPVGDFEVSNVLVLDIATATEG